jgi:Ca2+-binding EF-hand superfamily protein
MRGVGVGVRAGVHHWKADGSGGGDEDDDGDGADGAFFGGPSRAVTREHIAQSFRRFDAGDKGWLDRHDLKCAFASLTGYKPSALELQHIAARCPAGQVDQRHFAAYMEERLMGGDGGRNIYGAPPHGRSEHVRRVFKAFDVRHAG